MSLSITKKTIFDILQKSYPIIPLKSSLQILSNFKISLLNDILEISSTDLDHFLQVVTTVDSSDNFEIAVNARKLFEIVRELPDDIVHIDLSENVVSIKSENGFSCKIAGTDIGDYPGLPEINGTSSLKLPVSILRDLINKSCFAAAKDESRAVLCGVFFEIKDRKLGMVSTDGHRLGSSFLSIEELPDISLNCVISPKSLLNLSRILDGKNDDDVNIEIAEKYVVFSTPFFKMYSKLIEGPYPEYSKVIPKNNPKIAVITRDVLQIAVKRVSVLSNNKTHLIKFFFSANKLDIIVSNREIGGEAREGIEIKYEGDEHTIGFNSQYLLEILDIIKTENVRFEMNTQISACLIYPDYKEDEKKSDDLFLIMPLRILDDF